MSLKRVLKILENKIVINKSFNFVSNTFSLLEFEFIYATCDHFKIVLRKTKTADGYECADRIGRVPSRILQFKYSTKNRLHFRMVFCQFEFFFDVSRLLLFSEQPAATIGESVIVCISPLMKKAPTSF